MDKKLPREMKKALGKYYAQAAARRWEALFNN